MPTSMPACHGHSERQAAWQCPECDRLFCEECIEVRTRGATRFEMCKECDALCRPVADSAPPEPFGVSSLFPAASYPLAGGGKWIVAVGAAFMMLLDLFGLGLVGSALQLGYAMTILQSTIRGEDEPPEWQDVNGLWDLLRPLALGNAAALVAFGPALLLGSEGASGAFLCLFGFGLVYLPAAWIAVALSENALALNPVTVIALIGKLGTPYWTGAGAGFAILLGALGLSSVLGDALPWLLATALRVAVSFYALIVVARILGLACRGKRSELGWG